ADRMQCRAHVGMKIRTAIVNRDRLADEFDSLAAASTLVSDDTKKMQAVRVIGLASENLSIETLGLNEPACAVQDCGLLQRKSYADGRHTGSAAKIWDDVALVGRSAHQRCHILRKAVSTARA